MFKVLKHPPTCIETRCINFQHSSSVHTWTACISINMVSLTLLVLTAAFVAILYYLFKGKNKPGNTPPGPRGLPILGSLLSISFKPHIRFGEWVKLYGNIFSVKLANYDFIVINDHKIAKEANNNPALIGKPDFALFNVFANGNYGIFASHGQVWQEQRRFMLRNLRDFGFGKSTMQNLVMEEVSDYVGWLKSQEGQSISLNRKFTLATINALWMIMTGKRFPQNDPLITDFLDSTNKVFQDLLKSPVILFFPKLAQAFPKLFGWNKVVKLVEQNLAFVKKPVDEHKLEFSPENVPRDFIDSYLNEINKTKDPESTFYKESGEHSLHVVISDLFGAGSETTSSTLAWAMMYLSKFPEIQKKLYQELDQVLGKSKQPSLDDRKNLPYTEALIQEVLRKSSITAIGIFHSALEDTTLNGFTIPKDSWILLNHYHIHHNPEIWGDPENFRPERFLSEDGKTVLKNEALIPFSVGKRQCVGEQIARDSIFLFLTAIIQRFEISFDPSKPEPALESSSLMFLIPDPYFVIMKDRNV